MPIILGIVFSAKLLGIGRFAPEIGRIPNEGENLFLRIGQVVIKKSSSRKINEIQIFPTVK